MRSRLLLEKAEFIALVRGVGMHGRTKAALRDVVVHGLTWSSACKRRGVAQSTVLRALRRCRRAGPVTISRREAAGIGTNFLPKSTIGYPTPLCHPSEVGALVQRTARSTKIIRRIIMEAR